MRAPASARSGSSISRPRGSRSIANQPPKAIATSRSLSADNRSRPTRSPTSRSPSAISSAERDLSAPEPLGGEVGAFAQGAELGPHDAFLDELGAGERPKAAVDTGEHARLVAHGLDRRGVPCGIYLGYLDDVGRGFEDAGHAIPARQ